MSNYVNRKDLYEILQSMPSICVSDKYVFVGKDMYVRNDSIELPWILVSEQLPDGEGEVLITSIEGTVGMAWYYNGQFGVSES